MNIEKSLLSVLSIVLLLSSVVLKTKGLQIYERIKEVEEDVKSLKKEIETAYNDKSKLVRNCEPSYHQCTENFPDEFQCDKGHGTHKELCKDCNNDEMKLSYEHTTFLYPEGSFDPNNITPKQKETLCIHNGLTESMIKYGNKKTYSSFGTYDGIYRVWPMVSRDRPDWINDPNVLNCRPFDPRRRPWYIAASTGNKDVIVLVDNSISMNGITNERGDTAIMLVRSALAKLLETFSLGDFINVVEFNDNARALHSDQPLLSMRKNESVHELKKEIEILTAKGEANHIAGFEKAFDLFEEALNQEKDNNKQDNNKYSSNCTQILIFFTDGNMNEGDDVMGIIDYISKRQNQLKENYNKQGVNIFTYTIGNKSGDFLARVLACKNRGAWSYIDINEDDILTKMNSYFIYLADEKYNQAPVWTYPYEDDYGLGLMASCAIPFYTSVSNDINFFMGVVILDILLSEFKEELTEEETELIIDELYSESLTCNIFETNDCKFQALRTKAILGDISSVCSDDLDESDCYLYVSENDNNKKRYYIRSRNATTWTKAKDDCINNGGILSPVRDEEKHMFFLASIAKNGSWIGLKYSEKSQDTIFTWTDDTLDADKANYSYNGWVPFLNFDENHIIENQCVTIDFRGSDKNMNLVPCDKDIEYICEFEDGYQPNICNEQNATYEFKTSEHIENRYIGECKVEQKSIEEILSVDPFVFEYNNSTDTCHPLLNTNAIIETTFKDRTCCGCDGPNILSWVLISAACLIIVVIIIIYLIFASIKRLYPFHLPTLETKNCFEHYFCCWKRRNSYNVPTL